MTSSHSSLQLIAEEKDDTSHIKKCNQFNCIDLIVITTKTLFTV